ncbi:MAG: transcriptional regulator [Ruminococcaceae bacterium]|nr:transcriptional regulator [Oscillospiraceae bacterium]
MGLGAWAVVWLLGKPLRLLLRVAVGSGVLWLFDSLCGRFGVRLGLNGINASVVGLGGPFGLTALLLLRWMSL